MFSTKINSIEAQIQQLTQQLNSYRTLESELTSAVSAIARIKTAASELGVNEEVGAKLGLPNYEFEREKEVLETKLAVRERQFVSMVKERDERNAEIADLRNALAELEQKLESQAQQETGWVNLVEPPEELGEEDEEFFGEEEQPKITEAEARASILPPGPVQLSLPNIGVDSLVQVADGEVGRVLFVKDDMATVKLFNGASNFHFSALRYVGKYEEPVQPEQKSIPASDVPYSKIQEAARELYNFRTWAQIRAVLQSFAPATKGEILKEMAKTANNKTKTKFIENLPSLIAKFCEKGDRSDLDWLPTTVAQRVEQLLGQVAVA